MAIRSSPGGSTVVHPGYVVHSIPGRVRLQFAPRDAGYGYSLARRLQACPAVTQVWWNPAVPSLTVRYQDDWDFEALAVAALELDDSEATAVPQSRRVHWMNTAISCVVAALPLSPAAGLALAVATAVFSSPELRVERAPRDRTPQTC